MDSLKIVKFNECAFAQFDLKNQKLIAIIGLDIATRHTVLQSFKYLASTEDYPPQFEWTEVELLYKGKKFCRKFNSFFIDEVQTDRIRFSELTFVFVDFQMLSFAETASVEQLISFFTNSLKKVSNGIGFVSLKYDDFHMEDTHLKTTKSEIHALEEHLTNLDSEISIAKRRVSDCDRRIQLRRDADISKLAQAKSELRKLNGNLKFLVDEKISEISEMVPDFEADLDKLNLNKCVLENKLKVSEFENLNLKNVVTDLIAGLAAPCCALNFSTLSNTFFFKDIDLILKSKTENRMEIADLFLKHQTDNLDSISMEVSNLMGKVSLSASNHHKRLMESQNKLMNMPQNDLNSVVHEYKSQTETTLYDTLRSLTKLSFHGLEEQLCADDEWMPIFKFICQRQNKIYILCGEQMQEVQEALECEDVLEYRREIGDFREIEVVSKYKSFKQTELPFSLAKQYKKYEFLSSHVNALSAEFTNSVKSLFSEFVYIDSVSDDSLFVDMGITVIQKNLKICGFPRTTDVIQTCDNSATLLEEMEARLTKLNEINLAYREVELCAYKHETLCSMYFKFLGAFKGILNHISKEKQLLTEKVNTLKQQDYEPSGVFHMPSSLDAYPLIFSYTGTTLNIDKLTNAVLEYQNSMHQTDQILFDLVNLKLSMRYNEQAIAQLVSSKQKYEEIDLTDTTAIPCENKPISQLQQQIKNLKADISVYNQVLLNTFPTLTTVPLDEMKSLIMEEYTSLTHQRLQIAREKADLTLQTKQIHFDRQTRLETLTTKFASTVAYVYSKLTQKHTIQVELIGGSVSVQLTSNESNVNLKHLSSGERTLLVLAWHLALSFMLPHAVLCLAELENCLDKQKRDNFHSLLRSTLNSTSNTQIVLSTTQVQILHQCDLVIGGYRANKSKSLRKMRYISQNGGYSPPNNVDIDEFNLVEYMDGELGSVYNRQDRMEEMMASLEVETVYMESTL